MLKLRALSIASRFLLKRKNINCYENIGEIKEEESGIDRETKELLFFIIKKLSEKERFIIIKRFGIGGVPRRTLDELSKEMNCGITQIHQVEKRGILKMRKLYKIYGSD